MNINIKILYCLLLGGTLLSMDQANQDIQQKTNMLKLVAAYNLSSSKAIIGNNKCYERIPVTRSAYNLTKELEIPFISLKYYMKQFVKNIPYVPSNTLKIKTSKGLFHIWSSEPGILCARDPKNLSMDEWKMQVILKDMTDKKEKLSILKLFLLIDRLGNIKVKETKK